MVVGCSDRQVAGRHTCSETAELRLGLPASEQNMWNQPVCLQVRRRWVYGFFWLCHLSPKCNKCVFAALTSSQENRLQRCCVVQVPYSTPKNKIWWHSSTGKEKKRGRRRKKKRPLHRQTCSYIIFLSIVFITWPHHSILASLVLSFRRNFL